MLPYTIASSNPAAGFALRRDNRIPTSMRRFAAFCRTAALSLLTAVLVLGRPAAHSADPQPYVVDVKPSGDAALDSAVKDSSTLIALKDKTPVGGFALVQRARDDAARIGEAARAFGYYDGTVGISINTVPLDDPTLPDKIDSAPAKPPLPVVIAIDHGPRFHLGQITINGTLPPDFDPSLGISTGQDAVAANVLAARDRLLAALREASYPLATVILPDGLLHRDRQELDVSFQVDTGPKAALGAIRFTGLHDMSEAFVRQRLLLHPGDPFSPSAIEKAREDLLSLNVFSSVRILPAATLDANGRLPLNIEFQESKLHAVDLGAAWSTDLGANLNAAWTHRNLFGEGEQLKLSGAVQLGGDATTKPGYQLGAQFTKPDFLRRDQTLVVSLAAVDQSLLAYDQRALIEKVSVTRKLSDHWSVELGVLAEQEGITQEDVSRTYNFVGLPGSIKYDSTKSLLDPVEGIRASLSITPTQSLGGGGGTYFITQLSGSTYLDLSHDGRSVLAFRALVGKVSGVSVFGLPPDQRFYAGGTGTVRGYRYQSVGPLFADGRPTGGTAVSAGTIEFRQRFFESWGAATFIDVGQASADGKPFSSNMREGVGAGLRYYTPIGPIRLDFAIPMVPVRGGDSFEVYIGIGQAF
jgi:translocation and assembly module TamA